MHSRIILLATCMIIALLPQSQAVNYLPNAEARRLCRERTGLLDKDISDFKTRNENCAVDCITKQGTVLTAYVDDGHACHDTADSYTCALGKCRPADFKVEEDLNNVEINIKTAFVADRDPYPTQGESDAFVMVEVVSGGEPSFRDGEVICYTHVVQDNKRPVWNFSCKPLPLKSSAKLRFVVLDSDKPDTDPQLLGTAVRTLDSLMNSGKKTLQLEQLKLSGGPYWLEVQVSGKKYGSNK